MKSENVGMVSQVREFRLDSIIDIGSRDKSGTWGSTWKFISCSLWRDDSCSNSTFTWMCGSACLSSGAEGSSSMKSTGLVRCSEGLF